MKSSPSAFNWLISLYWIDFIVSWYSIRCVSIGHEHGCDNASFVHGTKTAVMKNGTRAFTRVSLAPSRCDHITKAVLHRHFCSMVGNFPTHNVCCPTTFPNAALQRVHFPPTFSQNSRVLRLLVQKASHWTHSNLLSWPKLRFKFGSIFFFAHIYHYNNIIVSIVPELCDQTIAVY